MNGGAAHPGIPFDHWRTYRLCRLFHCTPDQLGDGSAVEQDWLLAIDDLMRRQGQ